MLSLKCTRRPVIGYKKCIDLNNRLKDEEKRLKYFEDNQFQHIQREINSVQNRKERFNGTIS